MRKVIEDSVGKYCRIINTYKIHSHIMLNWQHFQLKFKPRHQLFGNLPALTI